MTENLKSVITDTLPAQPSGNTKVPELLGGVVWDSYNWICSLSSSQPQEFHLHLKRLDHILRTGGKRKIEQGLNSPINISINYPATCILFLFLREEESPYLLLDPQSREQLIWSSNGWMSNLWAPQSKKTSHLHCL